MRSLDTQNIYENLLTEVSGCVKVVYKLGTKLVQTPTFIHNQILRVGGMFTNQVVVTNLYKTSALAFPQGFLGNNSLTHSFMHTFHRTNNKVNKGKR